MEFTCTDFCLHDEKSVFCSHAYGLIPPTWLVYSLGALSRAVPVMATSGCPVGVHVAQLQSAMEPVDNIVSRAHKRPECVVHTVEQSHR